MLVRRLLAALAVFAVTSVGLVATPAVAGPYGPYTGSLTVSATVIKQGQTVRATGYRFCSNARVTVTVSEDGDTYIRRVIRAGDGGKASTTLRLTHLGSNVIKFSGCRRSGGTQVLSAKVRVNPYYGPAYVNDSTVRQGTSVKVWAYRFCDNASVRVTTYDDGRAYKSKTIRANGDGKATTWVRMSRVGRAKIAMTGCHRGGGTQVKTVPVRVLQNSGTTSGNAFGPVSAVADVSAVPVGLGLLLAVGLLLGLGRRRRKVTG